MNKFIFEKCSSIPEFTIFNSSNRVKIFSSCENKHINISLLDDYIKNNVSKYDDVKNCEKCKKEKHIKICQFCDKYLCEECNINHLTIEHILNNKIVQEISDNKYLDNIEKDDRFKVVDDKILKSIKYIKEIEEYYRKLENNFKKFLTDNINELILIKLLLKNYSENKNDEKLLNNIDFLLQFNKLEFKTTDLNNFLLDYKNYILDGNKFKGDKAIEDEFEGKGEMTYFNGKYDGEWKKGLREGFGIYKYNKYNDVDKYIGMWKNNLEEGNGRCIYKNGDIYDGYFKEGKKEGKGLYKYKDNKNNIVKYFGEWKNNKKNGEGIIYYNNGDEMEGIWENDIINNKKVTYRYGNGDW